MAEIIDHLSDGISAEFFIAGNLAHGKVSLGENNGGNMTSPDIRAGIALLIAAMSADGISRIHNIEQIDRGYQNIEGRLNALGARITRIE